MSRKQNRPLKKQKMCHETTQSPLPLPQPRGPINAFRSSRRDTTITNHLRNTRATTDLFDEMETLAPKQKPTILLDLPPEILELVLLRLDPESFSLMLMTCKAVRRSVLSSSKLLQVQLLRLPGLRLANSKTNFDMLNAFNRRASKHAKNGIQAMADTVTYRPSSTHIPMEVKQKSSDPKSLSPLWSRPRINLLQRCCSNRCELEHIAAAFDQDANIHIYSVRPSCTVPKGFLASSMLDLDGTDADSRSTRFKIVAAQFWKGPRSHHLDRLTALYQYELIAPRLPVEKQSPFIKDAMSRAQRTLKLVTWSMLDVCVMEVRDIVVGRDEEPKYLAVSHNNTVAIALQILYKPLQYRIRIYTSKSTPHGYDAEPQYSLLFEDVRTNVPPFPPPPPPPAVSIMRTSDLIFPAAMTALRVRSSGELKIYCNSTHPTYRVRDITAEDKKLEPVSMMPRRGIFEAYLGMLRGITIEVHHDHEIGEYEDGSKYCINIALQLVFQNNNIFGPGVYLMKSVNQDEFCRRWSLNDDIPFSEHLAIAKLMGAEPSNASPQGQMLAISSKRTRIAISEWDVVRIWSIFPSAFLDKNIGSRLVHDSDTDKRPKGCFKPLKSEEADGPEDMAYTTRCAHGYYHSYVKIKGEKPRRIVALEPVELPRVGVVHKLDFMSEDRLLAWTDRGLVSWYWGPDKSGERVETVLSMVAPGT